MALKHIPGNGGGSQPRVGLSDARIAAHPHLPTSAPPPPPGPPPPPPPPAAPPPGGAPPTPPLPQVHPLSVVLHLEDVEGATYLLHFHYLPGLELVTVKAENAFQQQVCSPVCGSQILPI